MPSKKKQPEPERERFEVENIEKHRSTKGGKIEYFIKWKGFSRSENTWEPESNLEDCGQVLHKYKLNMNKSAQKKPKSHKRAKDDQKQIGKQKQLTSYLSRQQDKQSSQEKAYTDDEQQQETEVKDNLPSTFKKSQYVVTGMSMDRSSTLKSSHDYIYQVSFKGKVMMLSRKQLIEKDTYALILFYEENLKFDVQNQKQ